MRKLFEKLIIGLLIFVLGYFLGNWIKQETTWGKIDDLNQKISSQLHKIDTLQQEMSGLESERERLLNIQTRINREQEKVISEMEQGGKSRREKLRLLSRYLAFIDSTLVADFSDSGSTATE